MCVVHKNDFVLAMAYVPWQQWEKLYSIDEALWNGTLFAELKKPFYGGCR